MSYFWRAINKIKPVSTSPCSMAPKLSSLRQGSSVVISYRKGLRKGGRLLDDAPLNRSEDIHLILSCDPHSPPLWLDMQFAPA